MIVLYSCPLVSSAQEIITKLIQEYSLSLSPSLSHCLSLSKIHSFSISLIKFSYIHIVALYYTCKCNYCDNFLYFMKTFNLFNHSFKFITIKQHNCYFVLFDLQKNKNLMWIYIYSDTFLHINVKNANSYLMFRPIIYSTIARIISTFKIHGNYIYMQLYCLIEAFINKQITVYNILAK